MAQMGRRSGLRRQYDLFCVRNQIVPVRKQRILLVSYHFPPSAAVGGQRIANFARFLPAYGWEPHILTIADKDIERLDPARVLGLAEVEIYKAGVCPTPVSVWVAAKRFARRFFSAQRMREDEDRLVIGVKGGQEREHLTRRLKRYLLSLLVLPDLQNGWIPTATFMAWRKVRRYRYDWVVTSCPPYSAHLIGLAVKYLTGGRWAADFRDPWMTADPKVLLPMSALSNRIESWLERKVVEESDLVVFNVERLRDAYRQRYAHVAEHKFICIPNGVSPFGPTEVRKNTSKYEVFTLSYTGALYVGRSPEPIFRAVSNLILSRKVKADEICIKLVGQCRMIDGVPTSLMIEKYGLEHVVEVHDPVSQAEALEIIHRSHLALLFAPKLAFQIPAKVYDYFSTGTRILAIADDGATADLIRQTGSGFTFAPDDISGIAECICEERAGRAPISATDPTVLARFEARSLTGELVGHLDRIAGASGNQ